MKLTDLSHDWRVVLGVGLIALGGANWGVGRIRTAQYGRMLSEQPAVAAADDSYRSFDELESADAVLEPFTWRQREASYTTARMDFYHATVMTGDAFVGGGLLLTCIGFLSLIRRDAARAAQGRARRSAGSAADG
jgi:hypothetical protein